MRKSIKTMPELSEYFGSGDANTLRRLTRWCMDSGRTGLHGGFRERFTAMVVLIFVRVLDDLLSAVAELDNTGPQPRSASDPHTVDWGD